MIKKIFKFLANLKLAIILLLLIAVFSGLGSIIEQDKELSFYQTTYSNNIKFINLKLFELIIYFGLNNIYKTNWFLLLLFIFGLSLISCTFLQQFPTLKFARRYYFYKKTTQLNKLNIQFSIKFVEFNLLLKQLNKLQYSIFQQSTTFYAYKGLIGRVAPIIVHLSIILILYGSVIGSFSGFTAQEFVPKTEIFHIQNIIKTGMISYIPQKTFRINDFWVQYNKEKTIKQFYSSISLLTGNGQELLYKTISVNKPLFYNDLIFYQTDWGITGLRIQSEEKNKEILQLPLYEIPNLNKKLWVSWLSVGNSVKKGILFLITQNQIQIYTQEGNFLSSLNINEFIELENLDLIKLIDVISSTGIQIKWDEGIIIIYIGFFLLILSSLLSYISFSELWGLKVSKKVFSGGKTNRAQLKFFLEIKKIK